MIKLLQIGDKNHNEKVILKLIWSHRIDPIPVDDASKDLPDQRIDRFS
ncbi:MAG: hypothetical protein Q4A75_09305 [Peptostreptococcaceae bacterium]|nr:hypothetical protein [Peptostreptococcaceae bacterium]